MSAASRVPLRFLFSLVGVAAGAGAFATLFRATLTAVYRTFYGADNVVDAITNLPIWMRFLVPVTAAALAGCIPRLFTPRAQGVSNVMEAIALGRVRLSLRSTIARVSASWIAIAGGLSIGREGPLIEMGGALGASIGRRLRVSLDQMRMLIAAGTAAGFAAAYNTPFAATLFVLETIAGIAAPQWLLPVMTATVAATVITRATVGAGPIYGERAFSVASNTELLSFALLGIAAAGVAMLFKVVLSAMERAFEARPLPQPFRAILGGLLVGVIATVVPNVAGNGYEPLNRVLNGEMVAQAVVALAVMKIIATSGSVASGIPGGIFTPMLLVGAATGAAWSNVGALGAVSSPGSYALVGMAAATAASIHAPLTASVMVFELTGDYAIALPLLLATVAATAASKAFGDESVYQAELKKRGLTMEITLEGRELKNIARE